MRSAMKTAMWVSVLVLFGPSVAQAQSFVSPIDADQATTCASSGSFGSGTYTLVGDIFSWDITFGDNAPGFDNGVLDAAETISHVHGPAAPGVPAGVLFGVALGNPKSGSVDISTIPLATEADLNAGLWYINIHSGVCPGGEIRGQILPAPPVPVLPTWGMALLAGLALLAIGGVVRARRVS